ncbi:MAG: hypothetical protein K5871_07795 [Lachnospiraceae bacterium]|nr:hypothetical protein [Lachnospiraceae bacterium]
MTQLLEIRDNIKVFFSKYDVFIIPVFKFLLALIMLIMINSKLGYMGRLNNAGIVLIVSLACSFLPTGAILLFGSLFSMGHIFALSPEVAIVVAVVYMLIYLLYLRFTPSESLCIVVTPMLFVFHVPYVIPVVMGLVGGPASALSVICGVIVYFTLHVVTQNAANVSGELSDILGQIKLIIDSLLGNKQMLVLVAAFAITTIAVYIIRRLPVEHCWTIAMISGAILNMLIVLIGSLVTKAGISFIGILFGSILAFLVGKVIEFFRFCVDYTRTERVQFEDDEYYYYVKAVPKMNVAAPDKKVKNINRSRKTYRPEPEKTPEEELEEYYEDEDMTIADDGSEE